MHYCIHRMGAAVVITFAIVITAVAAFTDDAANPSALSDSSLSWARLLDRAASDSGLETARNRLIQDARDIAALPVLRRAYTLAEVGTNRTWLDGRADALEPDIRETFALAMSDHGASNTMAKELPLLAAGFRLTGDAALRDRVLAQLDEMASWSPLQRPGWTLYAPGSRLPGDGKDGNWLATGTGVRALGDTIEILPEGTLPPELDARIKTLLETEIAGVCDDWQTKRPWFVRGNNPITNQWVLPTEGLVRACLILGVDAHRDAYELGVRNLMAALDAHGKQGEFEEGIGYADFTITALVSTARAMALAGDRRALDHPFLRNAPTWIVHHLQPGDCLINCFDAGGATGGGERLRPLLSLFAACTGSPQARWALAELTGGPSDNLAGLAARGLPPVGPDAAPPLFAVYERAARVNWRDSWRQDGTGVWVRGGHPMDQHDHQDRGHVNFIAHGKPILIEAGTPAYHHPRMMTHYSTCIGHNVLQLGTAEPDRQANAGEQFTMPGWQKPGGVAPITVQRLDAEGGQVQVDGTACYDGLARWNRSVAWSATQCTVTDDAALADGKTDIFTFRWHLGTEEEPVVNGQEGKWTVSWSGATVQIESNAPVTVTPVQMPDHTLPGHTPEDDPQNHHACLLVHSREPVNGITLTITASPAP